MKDVPPFIRPYDLITFRGTSYDVIGNLGRQRKRFSRLISSSGSMIGDLKIAVCSHRHTFHFLDYRGEEVSSSCQERESNPCHSLSREAFVSREGQPYGGTRPRAALIFSNEAKFLELVHEEINLGARRGDQFSV